MALFQPTGQVRLTNVAIVRLKKFGKNFEVPTYKNKILSWRDGNEEDFDEVVQIPRVFKNVSKGEYANKTEMMEVFGTHDEVEVCKMVMRLGEVQISEKEREAHFGSLWTEVVQLVSERVYDLRSGSRLSTTVLEKTLKDICFSVKPAIPAKRQALSAVNTLVTKRPNIIGRFKMQIRLTCNKAYKRDVETLLREVEATQVNSADADNGKWVEYTFSVHSAKYRDLEVGAQNLPDSGKIDILSQQLIDPVAMQEAKRVAEDEDVKANKKKAAIPQNPTNYAADEDDLTVLLHFDPESGSPLVGGGSAALTTVAGQRSTAVTAAPSHRPPVIPGALRKPVAAPTAPSATPDAPATTTAEEFTPVPAAAPPAKGMLCSTCKYVIMGGAVAFRAHSKEDWHAHNVKRKVRGLEPLVEEVFNTTSPKELAAFLAAD